VALLTDRIDAALLDAAPRLKVVSNYAVGFNNIDVPAATARGVAVGNTPGVLTDATADMAFCLLIAAARCVVDGHLYAKDGKWKTWEPLGHLGQDLVGRTLGVVGMGRIGYALAKRCARGWDMPVIYHDARRNEQAETELGARPVDLDTLLRTADFISVHTDLNDSTKGMFNMTRFKQMKPSAVFINTSRGPVVVEKDLVEALRTETIFAAGLDVTDPEPPAPDSPLFRQPRLVVAPPSVRVMRWHRFVPRICSPESAASLCRRGSIRMLRRSGGETQQSTGVELNRPGMPHCCDALCA
jgi:glyoxylate reductase